MDTFIKAIFLEQCGKNGTYRDTDTQGFQTEGGVCLPGGPEVMLSVVNMKGVCHRFPLTMLRWPFPKMQAGTLQVYICDYTYYLSLYLGNGHAELIHVPLLSHWLPAHLLGKAL
ncbi:Pgpep1l [Phodopus roborovskii]|uniref:Pgpep1l protein n=1 Tax=Phodopus roborovskii TaxID=109678 RepID=A0AAV0A6F8_PHORO|nr:Pgpep1l [Phodopus roborovskii]